MAAVAEVGSSGVGTAAVLDRIGGALWGLFIGDALAMPTHWYYGGELQVMSDYGDLLRGYTKPKEALKGSIMNLSSTGGGGRGSDKGEIIGNVINHGKKKYWTARGSYHYHCTLEKGENTLEAQLVRVVCKAMVENGGKFVSDDLRQRYNHFMTTPGTHNDCYASTCHRMYFANKMRGLPPEKCPDNDGHNVDTIDGLIMAVPVMLGSCSQPPKESAQAASDCIMVTRNSKVLPGYASEYANLLRDVLGGKSLKEAISSRAGPSALTECERRPDPVVA